MPFTLHDPTSDDGVREQLFSLDAIPGVLWTPEGATGPRALVLLAHGSGQHKRFPGTVEWARHYVTACGFAVAAIDAPGHGERPRSVADERHAESVRLLRASGKPVGPIVAARNAEIAKRAVPEWQAVLDALSDYAGEPVGFFGVALGTSIGIRLVAAERRITAAVFGLHAGDDLAAAAAGITVPVEFLLQWDDEMVSRQAGLALYDAFASAEKTLRANPGGHLDLPRFEVESSGRFFTRHLRRTNGEAHGFGTGSSE